MCTRYNYITSENLNNKVEKARKEKFFSCCCRHLTRFFAVLLLIFLGELKVGSSFCAYLSRDMLCSVILSYCRKIHALVELKTKGETSVGDISHVLSPCRCSIAHAEKPNGFIAIDILHREEKGQNEMAKSFLKSVKVTFVLHISSHILCSVTFM